MYYNLKSYTHIANMSRYNKEEQHITADNLNAEYGCRIRKNEIEPYALFCCSDLGKILKLSNIRVSICNFDCGLKCIIDTETITGQKKCAYLTFEGLLKLLISSRKPETIKVGEKIGINIETVGFACIEAETIKCIEDCFFNETILREYIIKPYRVDLYFPEYCLIIECDESAHKRHQVDDRKREEDIISVYPNVKFIRYRPQEKNFNVFEICGRIHNHIANCLREVR